MIKRGGNTRPAGGFTIVEVLIVLAVTSILFITATLAISGQQNKTEFSVGSRGIRAQIQTVLNEAISGYYPSTGDFACSYVSGSNLAIGSAPAEQGTNAGCVFLGNALVFGQSYINEFRVFPLAGSRLATSFSNSKLTAISPTPPPSALSNASDLSQSKMLPNGFEYRRGWVDGGLFPGTTPVALIFTQSINPATPSQQLEMRRLKATAPVSPFSPQKYSSWINTAATIPDITDSPDVRLCFSQGAGAKNSVLISFVNGSTEPSLDIRPGADCL